MFVNWVNTPTITIRIAQKESEAFSFLNAATRPRDQFPDCHRAGWQTGRLDSWLADWPRRIVVVIIFVKRKVLDLDPPRSFRQSRKPYSSLHEKKERKISAFLITRPCLKNELWILGCR